MAEGGTFYSGFFFSESFIQVLHNNPWDWEIGIYGLEKSCNYHITMCRHASRHIECSNCCPGYGKQLQVDGSIVIRSIFRTTVQY